MEKIKLIVEVAVKVEARLRQIMDEVGLSSYGDAIAYLCAVIGNCPLGFRRGNQIYREKVGYKEDPDERNTAGFDE